ncbi:MAG: DNA repair exonuclease [candidate division KSB1 bacterium]|nr:DNA repair exonuclease [candidate division KSB1 bacterium]MDZ7272809.1 DNA repair exonuclease [candidate division KSB1 bacterium]MDZ7284167.1 DNA repair exonuclease [candidate division KSB1 bacterium]MDZ7297435.1 DNA repair exonuclease [candidate division KSB1 bacterium]MDZ7308183.1 DNA repair exonuclease [candidate division KSB1 bacterium]
MRFIHFADTHLGFSDLARVDPQTGVNRREQDFYDAWWRVIDAILLHKPDFVLHAGDLFQSPRPNNRAIAVALAGLQQLQEANIPFVVVAGNHSTPRIRATGNIFEALRVLPMVHAVYQGAYEKIVLHSRDGKTSCAVHCIPHCSLSEALEQAYAALRWDDSATWNILLSHGAWRAAGKIDTRMGEFNEQMLEDPETRLNLRFDYIALGHYHRHLAINDHTFYSGSTERTSFNEAGYTSGYLVGDLTTREWRYHQIPARPMLRLPPVNARGKTREELMAEVARLSTADLTDAMVSLAIAELSRDLYLQLDFAAIERLFPQVFHLNRQITLAATGANGRGGEAAPALGSLREEFARYLQTHSDGSLPRAELERLGAQFLAEAEAQELEA